MFNYRLLFYVFVQYSCGLNDRNILCQIFQESTREKFREKYTLRFKFFIQTFYKIKEKRLQRLSKVEKSI
jgi:hypothetical protein